MMKRSHSAGSSLNRQSLQRMEQMNQKLAAGIDINKLLLNKEVLKVDHNGIAQSDYSNDAQKNGRGLAA
ncbi:hypothetical protein BTO30_04080 [Domibacillus antri]|uniref:Uncharacterized protein n=1 Tax=Domibacillus antri TaxID=1714264 RepID=A0A1Q8Q743_9BACI|nr:hypothetical protein [Domibacillus antri]OLN23157.1 hypothetical protein BTO30_04080 [Domibacillus antri]